MVQQSAVFNVDYNEALVHQVVTAYRNGGRAGTVAQKNRSAVRGGGKKPWRQKGTGRARAGTSSSPIWVGGGRTFAAKPRDYSQKVNKKMYRAGMKVIISELMRAEDRLQLLDSFKLNNSESESAKTKDFIKLISGVLQLKSDFRDNMHQKILIILPDWDPALELAARNLYNIAITTPDYLDPFTLLQANKVLIVKDAMQKLEEVYA